MGEIGISALHPSELHRRAAGIFSLMVRQHFRTDALTITRGREVVEVSDGGPFVVEIVGYGGARWVDSRLVTIFAVSILRPAILEYDSAWVIGPRFDLAGNRVPPENLIAA